MNLGLANEALEAALIHLTYSPWQKDLWHWTRYIKQVLLRHY